MLSLLLSNSDTFVSCVNQVEEQTSGYDPIIYEMQQINFQPFAQVSSDSSNTVLTKELKLKYHNFDKKLLNSVNKRSKQNA